MFTFTWSVATLLVLLGIVQGSILPLIVGLVTTKVTSPLRKGLILLGLNLIAAIVTQVITTLSTSDPLDVFVFLLQVSVPFVIGVAAQFGIYSRPNSDGVSISDKLVALGVNSEPGEHADLSKPIDSSPPSE